MGYYSRVSPFGFPLFNNGKTLLRPVYANDVATGIARLALEPSADGGVYEFYGPRTYEYGSIVEFFLDVSKREPFVWNCPRTFGRLLGRFIENISLHAPVISVESVEKQMFLDEIPTAGTRTFKDVGLTPLTLEETILRFIKKYRPAEYQLTSFEVDVRKYLEKGIGVKA
ncbi:39kDa subunit of ndufa9, NADH:ubiquinone oxidoreductase [Phlyctochytrium bullatum]|nr:39kDa subunit of ndufa9, NADH:ubiquinone oxidoreductase [Phlyctochytrium bullatum]